MSYSSIIVHAKVARIDDQRKRLNAVLATVEIVTEALPGELTRRRAANQRNAHGPDQREDIAVPRGLCTGGAEAVRRRARLSAGLVRRCAHFESENVVGDHI